MLLILYSNLSRFIAYIRISSLLFWDAAVLASAKSWELVIESASMLSFFLVFPPFFNGIPPPPNSLPPSLMWYFFFRFSSLIYSVFYCRFILLKIGQRCMSMFPLQKNYVDFMTKHGVLMWSWKIRLKLHGPRYSFLVHIYQIMWWRWHLQRNF